MRAFDHVFEKMQKKLAAVCDDRAHDFVDADRLRDRLDHVEYKRCELRKGNVVRGCFIPDLTVRRLRPHPPSEPPPQHLHAESACRWRSRRSRSPAWRRSSSPSSAPATAPKRAALATRLLQKMMKSRRNRSSPSSGSVSGAEEDPAARTHQKRTTLTEAPQQQVKSAHSPPQAASRQQNAKIDAERTKNKDVLQPKREAQSEEKTRNEFLVEGIHEALAAGKRASAASAAKKIAKAASHQQNTKKIDAKRAKTNDVLQPKREAQSDKTRDEPIAEQIASAAAAEKIAAAASAEKIADAASPEKTTEAWIAAKIAEAASADTLNDWADAATRPSLARGDTLSELAGQGQGASAELRQASSSSSSTPFVPKRMSLLGACEGDELELGGGRLASVRATDIYADDLSPRRWMIFLKSPTRDLEMDCKGKVHSFYCFAVDWLRGHLTKRTTNTYARAVAAAKQGLEMGGIGNRYYPLICYTSLLPPLLATTFFWGDKCNFGFFSCFSQKKVLQVRGARCRK